MASTDAYDATAGKHRDSGRKRKKGRLSGHAKLLAGPAYGKFAAVEPALRRLVPALIIIFLIILGVARVFSMLSWREDIELQHKAALSAATANLAQMIERAANGTQAGAQMSPKDLDNTIAEFRSRGLSSSGMTVALSMMTPLSSPLPALQRTSSANGLTMCSATSNRFSCLRSAQAF
jgi:two-component system cell cycle sensor histidine kinase PleC